jgi:hypothetical protein
MAGGPSMAARGRLGGLTTAARHGGTAATQAARDTYRQSFREGHGCRVCPRVDIPFDLPDDERERRGEYLRRAHFARMAMARQSS